MLAGVVPLLVLVHSHEPQIYEKKNSFIVITWFVVNYYCPRIQMVFLKELIL